jgi:decaprenylphospho-beta-D-ribofuranose 2-oxidase
VSREEASGGTRSGRQVLTGWGQTAPTVADVVAPSSVEELARLLEGRAGRGAIARGLGRSYGDAAQNSGGLVVTLDGLDEIGPVDPDTGQVACGAGVSLDRLIAAVLPQGWFLPVTPGTRQVTLGGAIAADVHGKNHHRDGTISAHIVSLVLVDGSGVPRVLTPEDDLFWAVPGAMGLSGVIVAATLRLLPVRSGDMVVDICRTESLDGTMARLEEADRTHRYSVAWVDGLTRGSGMGRGVVTAGDHADPSDGVPVNGSRIDGSRIDGSRIDGAAGQPTSLAGRTVTVPRRVPPALNPLTVRAFNELYHRRAPRAGRRIEPLGSFFHPLDAVHGWNRLYGTRGVLQHQCTVPDAEAMRRVLSVFADGRAPAFLCVLKRFGAQGSAPLSFPQPGWTLSVDLPVGDGIGALLDRVDTEVLESGGRVYLAKDARLAPWAFAAMYPRLEEWRRLRDELDPEHVFMSDLARRLHL